MNIQAAIRRQRRITLPLLSFVLFACSTLCTEQTWAQKQNHKNNKTVTRQNRSRASIEHNSPMSSTASLDGRQHRLDAASKSSLNSGSRLLRANVPSNSNLTLKRQKGFIGPIAIVVVGSALLGTGVVAALFDLGPLLTPLVGSAAGVSTFFLAIRQPAQ